MSDLTRARGGHPASALGFSKLLAASVTVRFSSAELRRVAADPAGGLPLREDLRRQRPGLPG